MKNWIKTNFYKIISILALFLAITGLIVGSIAHYKTNDLQYYLNHDYKAQWGGATIWEHKRNDKYKIDLYFYIKPFNSNDIKWDGKYPNGYFYN